MSDSSASLSRKAIAENDRGPPVASGGPLD
jgi:hypothetical protein